MSDEDEGMFVIYFHGRELKFLPSQVFRIGDEVMFVNDQMSLCATVVESSFDVLKAGGIE